MLHSGVTAGVGGRGRVPLDTSHREISADLPGKERQGKKGKLRRKEEKPTKGRWKIGNRKGKGKVIKWREDLFSLFKTTEICFGSTKMRIFYRENAFHAGKKSEKMTLPPLKYIPLIYASVLHYVQIQFAELKNIKAGILILVWKNNFQAE